MFLKSRYIAILEAKIKSLENELQRTQNQRDSERRHLENRIEELIARLLIKHGVTEAKPTIKADRPEDLGDMTIFDDVDELVDNRKGDKSDAFAG